MSNEILIPFSEEELKTELDLIDIMDVDDEARKLLGEEEFQNWLNDMFNNEGFLAGQVAYQKICELLDIPCPFEITYQFEIKNNEFVDFSKI